MIGCSPQAGILVWREHTLIYMCGSNLVLHNTHDKSQRYLPCLPNSKGITCMKFSPCQRFLAVSERSEQAIVFIYDLLMPSRRRKVLTNNELKATEFVSMDFIAPADKL